MRTMRERRRLTDQNWINGTSTGTSGSGSGSGSGSRSWRIRRRRNTSQPAADDTASLYSYTQERRRRVQSNGDDIGADVLVWFYSLDESTDILTYAAMSFVCSEHKQILIESGQSQGSVRGVPGICPQIDALGGAATDAKVKQIFLEFGAASALNLESLDRGFNGTHPNSAAIKAIYVFSSKVSDKVVKFLMGFDKRAKDAGTDLAVAYTGKTMWNSSTMVALSADMKLAAGCVQGGALMNKRFDF